jgi:alanyl-tRNA synthetase
MSTQEAVFSKAAWPGNKVRQTFIDFFVNKEFKGVGHVNVPSSPILPPAEETTLLFANSGMNQFKPCFMGLIDEKHDWKDMKAACNTQKCLRAGGKHNDLEEVGFDVYHHTFFEMLGNWSFGHYFKEEAIAWSWELLTEVYKIPKDRLYATYYAGDPKKPGVPADLEARDIWRKYLPDKRIIASNAKDNFWEMGATGPCGPCTEIHFDRIGNREVPELVNADLPEVLEIWNNVFMQYYCDENGTLTELPAQHVDTGMGFERLTSVLQGVDSNYDTDIFDPIFAAIEKDTKCRPYTGKVGDEDADGVDMAYRVIADHIRALTFSIADRIDPDSDGRGYVLRRILRRGVRYGKEFLGAEAGFFARLVDVVVDHMGGAFPELIARREHVKSVIAAEEMQFARSLDKGTKQFNKAISSLSAGDKLESKVAVELYTTYGFPIDLTRLMCDEKKIQLSEEACEKELELFKDISRRGNDTGGVELKLAPLQTDYLSNHNVAATDDTLKYDWKSVGTGPTPSAEVKAIYIGQRDDIPHTVGFVDSVDSEVGRFGVVLDRTNFYGERGGQTFDIGELKAADGTTISIVDTRPFGAFVLHIGVLHPGQTLAVGKAVTCHVDYERRAAIAKNHTTTHLLNFALRKVLQGDTDQEGSNVLPDKLTFDFNAKKGLTPAQLSQVQGVVQEFVDNKSVVDRKACPKEEALAIKGLRAMFGATYPSIVRVVAVIPQGETWNIDQMIATPDSKEWFNTSVEFCGGTHLDNAGEAGRFLITSEGSIKSGTRRIVAVTGDKAEEVYTNAVDLKTKFDAAAALPAGPDMQAAIKKLTVELSEAELPHLQKLELQKMLKDLNKKDIAYKKKAEKALETAAMALVTTWAEEKKDATSIVSSLEVSGNSKALKKAAKTLKKLNVPILLYSAKTDGKSVSVLASVPAPLNATFAAKDWANAFVGVMGGKAGGSNAESSGAARDLSKLDEAVAAATKLIESALA